MKYVITIILVMFLQLSHAEKLIFTNNNEEVNITGDAQIDFETGDISVETVGDFLIVDENAPVILGFFPDDYDISLGSSITVNWSVAFAVSCTASVSSGTATWNGNKTSNNGNWSESGVSVSVLPARLNLDCKNALGVSTIETFDLTEQVSGGGGGGSNPAINSFRVNSQSPFATVGPATTATVSWTTTDVSGCVASANPPVTGWSGNKPASGPQTVTITQSTEMKLTCGTLESNVSVTYTQNSSCNTSIYPPNLNIVQATYESINDNEPFGASTNTSFLLNMANSEFHSLSDFSFPQTNARRRIVFSDAPTNFRLIAQGTMSVSECPGDFSNTAVCVIPVNNNSTVLFSTKASDSASAFCKLDPTKTYFVNYVNSPDPYNVPPSCASASNFSCAMFYSETAL